MCDESIVVTESAWTLYERLWRAERPAFHVAWATPHGQLGRWTVGFTPEAEVLSASAEDQRMIVAGRVRGVLVIMHAQWIGPASEQRIVIDADLDDCSFNVNVSTKN